MTPPLLAILKAGTFLFALPPLLPRDRLAELVAPDFPGDLRLFDETFLSTAAGFSFGMLTFLCIKRQRGKKIEVCGIMDQIEIGKLLQKLPIYK